MSSESVAIIGGGPAGIAAVIQLARYGISPLLFEKAGLGGLLVNAYLVENYPGFPKGIPGPDLVELFKSQLRESGIGSILEEVTGIEITGDAFLLNTTGGEYRTGYVIIASGTRPKRWDGPPVPEGLEERVLHEVYPLRHLRDQTIVVIGAGDAALDYALNLARANDVTILNRGTRVRSLPVLRQRVDRNPRISYRAETFPTEITAAEEDRLLIQCTARDGVSAVEADYLLLAIGREPSLDFLDPGIMVEREAFSDRLYFAGDVAGGRRQTAIAVGDGIRAAMGIAEKIG